MMDDSLGLFCRSPGHLPQATRPVWKQEALDGILRSHLDRRGSKETADGERCSVSAPREILKEKTFHLSQVVCKVICLRQEAGPDGQGEAPSASGVQLWMYHC